MLDLTVIILRITVWLRLLACADPAIAESATDRGGVRCASVAAAGVVAPWKDARGDQRGGAARAGGAFLAAVARAESHSRPVGVHAGDAKIGRKFWTGAVKAGWLKPATCPGHALTAGGPRGRGWAPRGAWGVAAAYATRHLGWIGCTFGPALLDHPVIGAYAAAQHLKHCARVRRTRNPDEIRVCWAGGAKRRADVLKRWRRGDLQDETVRSR